MTKEIKLLTIEDYDDIIRVWSDAGLPFVPKGRDSRERLGLEMSREDTAFYGLFIDDRMIGTVIANYDGRRGWINHLAIDPEYRGIGFGGDLIEAAEAFLKERGALVISALIEDVNTPSMSCFEKHGFVCWAPIKYFSKRDSMDN